MPQKRVKAVLYSLLVLGSLFIYTHSTAQNTKLVNGKMLSKAQLLEDYDLLYSSLINYHPRPFAYTTEADFKQYYEQQRAAFGDSLPERVFYVACRQLLATLKCGHSSALISQDWYANLKGNNVLMPIDVKFIGEQAFIKNIVDTSLAFTIGDEVLSINQVPISTLLKEMLSSQVRDGLHLSFATDAVSLNFRMYYLFFYGAPSQYAIEYRTAAGETKQSILPAIPKKLKELQKPGLPAGFQPQLSNDWSVFAIDSSRQLAYLKIKNFSDRRQFNKYYRQVFDYLKLHPEYQLLLDLRDNTGGYFGHGGGLLRYFSTEKFELNFEREKRKINKNKHTKMDPVNRLTKLAFGIKPPKHRSKTHKTVTFGYKPKKTPFAGKLHVLTNGISFSTATVVSAHLKAEGATFYGAETGGTESGTNAILNHQLLMPHSQMRISIPYYYVFGKSQDAVFGRGVQPKYPLLPQVGSHQDDVLEAVLQLMRKAD